jgi:hypothetical protein
MGWTVDWYLRAPPVRATKHRESSRMILRWSGMSIAGIIPDSPSNGIQNGRFKNEPDQMPVSQATLI